MQVAVPFFIAGCGTIGAGIVLGNVRVSNAYFNTIISKDQNLTTTLNSRLEANFNMVIQSLERDIHHGYYLF